MTRERWQDKVEVRAARAHYLNVRMHADICADVQATCEEAEAVDAETLQAARNNALFAEAKAHEALDAICEAVAACGDASPSETTCATAVAWQVDIEGSRPFALFDHLPYAERHCAERRSAGFPARIVPLYSAPPAGDGVPREGK